jgi:hypothetical protein
MARTRISMGDDKGRTAVVGTNRESRIPAQFTGVEADDDTMVNDGDDCEGVAADTDPENDDIESEETDTAMGKHADPPIDLGLDEDPETALVGSLSLHMLSEHNISGALHLSHDALNAEHQRAHREHGQSHGIADWRFRPTRALAAAMLQYNEEETPPLTAAATV